MDNIETKTCTVCKKTKDIVMFEKNRCKCKSCRIKAMSKQAVKNLPDWYIRRVLKKAKQSFSQEDIDHKRKSILNERKIRKQDALFMIDSSRQCKTCNQIKDIKQFKDGTKCKRMCITCRNNTPKALLNKKRYKESLTDCIVKGNIMAIVNKYLDKKYRVKASDIPRDFVELKRKELILKKQIEHGNKSNHQENSTKSH